MTAMVQARYREHGETALRWLDELPDKNNAQERMQIAAIIQQLVAMRDDLIERRRAGEACGDALRRTNAILSSLFGTEFPLNELQLKRVCETRDALREMLKA
jgi:hypothetical protein